MCVKIVIQWRRTLLSLHVDTLNRAMRRIGSGKWGGAYVNRTVLADAGADASAGSALYRSHPRSAYWPVLTPVSRTPPRTRSNLRVDHVSNDLHGTVATQIVVTRICMKI